MAMNVVGAMQYASRIEREALHAKMAATRRAALIDQAVRNVLNVWDGKTAYTSWREHQLPQMASLHEAAIRSEFRRLKAENDQAIHS